MNIQPPPESGKQTHWEVDSNGSPVQVRNQTPMNDEQRLRKDQQTFAASLPIDKLAEYKDALASGDPSKMEKFRGSLPPREAKLLESIETQQSNTLLGQLKTVGNMALLSMGISALGGYNVGPGAETEFGRLMSGGNFMSMGTGNFTGLNPPPQPAVAAPAASPVAQVTTPNLDLPSFDMKSPFGA